jgi:hypothetical protein
MRALLSDPGGTSALGHCCALVLPSALPTASAPTRTVISRLNHTARMLAVYASQDGLPHHHARLASGCLASVAGRGLPPAGSHRRFLRSFVASSFSKLSWRTGSVRLAVRPLVLRLACISSSRSRSTPAPPNLADPTPTSPPAPWPSPPTANSRSPPRATPAPRLSTPPISSSPAARSSAVRAATSREKQPHYPRLSPVCAKVAG